MPVLQTITELNTKYKGDALDNELKTLRPLYKSIRKEISEIKDDNQALSSIAKIDGLLTLPVVNDIFAALKKQYVEDIFYQCGELDIQIALNKLMHDAGAQSLDDLFPFYYNKWKNNRVFKLSLKEIFEKELPYNEEVNELKVDGFYQKMLKLMMAELTPLVAKENSEKLKLLENTVRTYLFLIHANTVYAISDESQCLSKPALVKKVATGEISKNTIEKAYQGLLEASKHITVSDETAAQWKEVAMWLQGLYKRIYDLMPKDTDGTTVKKENGSYPPIATDDHDLQMKKHIGLSKYEVSIYHKGLSDNILASLPKKEEKLQTKEQPSVIEPIPMKMTPLTIKLEKKEEVPQQKNVPVITQTPQPLPHAIDKPVIQATPNLEQINNQNKMPDDDFITVTIKVPKSKKALVSQIKKFAESKINSTRQVVDDSVISYEMIAVSEATSEVKISRLNLCLEKYELTQTQMEDIHTMVTRAAKIELAKYIESAKKASNAYGYGYFFGPGHIEDAKSVLTELKNMSDAREQVQKLLDLQEKLSVEHSGTLLPAVNGILIDVCHYFVDRVRLVNENPVQSERSTL